MTDNVNVEDSVTGVDIPVSTDDVGGVAYQRVKLDIGADGATSGTAGTAGVPLRVDPTGTTTQPVSLASAPLGTGAATAANQTTLIGHVDGLEGLLTTIDGDTGNISTKVDTLAGAVSGTEMQVDVLTMPTVTVQDGGGSITVDGSVTANAGTNLNTSALALDATLSTASTRIGDLTESAPASDTASSGLNGRLQRIAQLLTTIIARNPTSLGQKTMATSFGVVVASDQTAVPTSVADGSSVTLGAKADAKSTATDTTAITAMSVWKQISASVQAIATSVAGSLTISGTVTAAQGTAASLNMTEASAAAIKTAVEIMDDWDETDRAKVNPIVGQAGIAAGAGAVGATVPRTTLASDDPAVASLSVMDDWDESDRAKVNPIVGQAGVAAGAGAVGATVQRATLASDDPAVASLSVIDDWDESDRAKVNPIVGQAGIAGGTGVDGATVPRVSLATNVALPAGTNNIGDVDVLTIAAGTNNIGRVGASVVEIAGTINGANTIAAAGDYAALDVFSHTTSAGSGVSWSFASIARESGGSGTITRALIMSSAETMTARVRLWLFNAAPTTATEMDDNAAFLLDEDDYLKLVGWIDFPSFERAGAAGEVAVALNDTVRLAFKCSADANLRGITQFVDAEANEAASMVVHIRLQATQD